MSQPRIISISQSTEYGTLYTIPEIGALAALAHQHRMYLHIDGARLANAAASLNCTLEEMTAAAGADVVSFGGTKNGLLFGEAVIFLTNQDKLPDFVYYRKQGMQLLSKMRWLNAQFAAYIKDELWREAALQANRMAQYFARQLSEIPAVTVTQPVTVNAVFAILPPAVIPPLMEKYHFYVWNEARHEVRLMCSWDTTPGMIDQFIADLQGSLLSFTPL
jgi:threonine aldolase